MGGWIHRYSTCAYLTLNNLIKLPHGQRNISDSRVIVHTEGLLHVYTEHTN